MRVIVVGNEKGGSGKTTVAMHVAVGLARLGFAVGAVDLDARQHSLTRYIDNRRMWCEDHDAALPTAHHRLIGRSSQDSAAAALAEEQRLLTEAVSDLGAICDFVVIDCAAGDTPLSRFAHGLADTLVTPLNDSFVDIDLLLQFRPGTLQVLDAGVYFRMLWELRRDARREGGDGFEWIILRNRLSGLADQNKRTLHKILRKIAPIIECRLAGGLGERVIFRQLFAQGLTVFDIGEPGVDIVATASHAAARQELQDLFETLRINLMEDSLAIL